MSELLGYILRPEESISTLLIERDRSKWKQILLYWIRLVVLLGLSTMATYRLSGVGISDILGTNFIDLIHSTFGVQMSEGAVWITSTIILVMQTLVIVMFKFIIWSIVLYLVGMIIKKELKVYDVILLSMIAMQTRLVAQIITVIAVTIANFCPIFFINQMLVGIAMILDYWYLIVLAIGFTVLTRSTFLKGGMVILVIQGFFWLLGSMVPWLQVILG